ncbi:MAG: hypothetical protein F4X66_17535 [Chloroflexi bacterium]|nr:hypothetical protein [Chloroflexota bacterium]
MTRTLLKAAFALAVLALIAMVAFIFLLWPTSTESTSVVIHWGAVPDQERAGVIAAMERERDVFRATFEQLGRDISLGLMVMHPMDIERAGYLAETFADSANEAAQPYAEVQPGEDGVRPDLLPAYRYSVRVFSMNDVFTAG